MPTGPLSSSRPAPRRCTNATAKSARSWPSWHTWKRRWPPKGGRQQRPRWAAAASFAGHRLPAWQGTGCWLCGEHASGCRAQAASPAGRLPGQAPSGGSCGSDCSCCRRRAAPSACCARCSHGAARAPPQAKQQQSQQSLGRLREQLHWSGKEADALKRQLGDRDSQLQALGRRGAPPGAAPGSSVAGTPWRRPIPSGGLGTSGPPLGTGLHSTGTTAGAPRRL